MSTDGRRRLATTAEVLVASCLIAASPNQAAVGFLGPRGTFSELAAEAYRDRVTGAGATRPFETMTAVVDAVRAGSIPTGILPVASTVAGFPEESERLLLGEDDPGFRVIGEVVVPVELHLVATPGTDQARIRRILSHPNALGEAQAFLGARYAGVPREETASTAAAAARVEAGDGTLAAVASVAAARLYGLEILEHAIQDNPDNATSFWAIARSGRVPEPDRARRLIVLLEGPAGSTVLSTAISNLEDLGFAVVFVNSRPLPGALYGFRYIVSLAADVPVPGRHMRRAMASVSSEGRALVLGWFD